MSKTTLVGAALLGFLVFLLLTTEDWSAGLSTHEYDKAEGIAREAARVPMER